MENLSNYLSASIENIIKRFVKFSVGNLREISFALTFMRLSKKARQRREQYLIKDQSIPPFLIASITKNCNLFCKGCYSRELQGRCNADSEFTSEKWDEIFSEAESLGISFILLAGGEPFMRPDVIKTAALHKSIVFPIFTNGTMFNDEYIKLFNKHRNLLPVFSIEGEQLQTDKRRGENVFNSIMTSMSNLRKRKIVFGASVTVTTENVSLVTSYDFTKSLYDKGCAVVFFIEYVPVSSETEKLAPTNETRTVLDNALAKLKLKYDDMIFISFPGDEKYMGGCLAAGRGFFHISATGNAEPCPFSPYSDINLKDSTILQALNSPLFNALKQNGILNEQHQGGCTLFARKEEVEKLMKQ